MGKGPSALDLEVRSLSPEGGGSIGLMQQFLLMLHSGLLAKRHFEAVQAYLGLFLKVRMLLFCRNFNILETKRNFDLEAIGLRTDRIMRI
jgi:Utp21 specific WD40 associated putative domain